MNDPRLAHAYQIPSDPMSSYPINALGITSTDPDFELKLLLNNAVEQSVASTPLGFMQPQSGDLTSYGTLGYTSADASAPAGILFEPHAGLDPALITMLSQLALSQPRWLGTRVPDAPMLLSQPLPLDTRPPPSPFRRPLHTPLPHETISPALLHMPNPLITPYVPLTPPATPQLQAPSLSPLPSFGLLSLSEASPYVIPSAISPASPAPSTPSLVSDSGSWSSGASELASPSPAPTAQRMLIELDERAKPHTLALRTPHKASCRTAPYARRPAGLPPPLTQGSYSGRFKQLRITKTSSRNAVCADVALPAPVVCLDGTLSCPDCNEHGPFTNTSAAKRHIMTHYPQLRSENLVCAGVRIGLDDARTVVEWDRCREDKNGQVWYGGCWKTFARPDALKRHLKSRAGKDCRYGLPEMQSYMSTTEFMA